ncbi:uncharacterized protein LOC121426398 isoform X2 [Lytechinus variegatus]|uniref:uncharacterized protein LOC121426398 isoform X2 n=1 Tax=Lytechinus variegatus TaxID=7654 RepID=UPI001BB1C925|nr:uncharacterized protein LOC121426398 isoform X2 [Lytechinus variegatus]
MDLNTIRLATEYEGEVLYEFLNEYVKSEGLETLFGNSKQNFLEHFKQKLFQALVIENKSEKQLVGCAFISTGFHYHTGEWRHLHCCYIRHPFKSHKLERKVIQTVKRICFEEKANTLTTIVNGNNLSTLQVLEAENCRNAKPAEQVHRHFWFMQSQYSTGSDYEINNTDYVIRDGMLEDDEERNRVCQLLEESLISHGILGHRTLIRKYMERNALLVDDKYGAVVLEHLRCVDGDGMTSIRDIVGCVLYSTLYNALKGKTYILHGLSINPAHRDLSEI